MLQDANSKKILDANSRTKFPTSRPTFDLNLTLLDKENGKLNKSQNCADNGI